MLAPQPPVPHLHCRDRCAIVATQLLEQFVRTELGDANLAARVAAVGDFLEGEFRALVQGEFVDPRATISNAAAHLCVCRMHNPAAALGQHAKPRFDELTQLLKSAWVQKKQHQHDVLTFARDHIIPDLVTDYPEHTEMLKAAQMAVTEHLANPAPSKGRPRKPHPTLVVPGIEVGLCDTCSAALDVFGDVARAAADLGVGDAAAAQMAQRVQAHQTYFNTATAHIVRDVHLSCTFRRRKNAVSDTHVHVVIDYKKKVRLGRVRQGMRLRRAHTLRRSPLWFPPPWRVTTVQLRKAARNSVRCVASHALCVAGGGGISFGSVLTVFLWACRCRVWYPTRGCHQGRLLRV